jgi:hypothetical protein
MHVFFSCIKGFGVLITHLLLEGSISKSPLYFDPIYGCNLFCVIKFTESNNTAV